MKTVLRTPQREAAWSSALSAARRAGLIEDDAVYWPYVRAKFAQTIRFTKSHYALRDFAKSQRTMPFKVNSGGFKTAEPEPFEPQGSLDQAPPRAMLDGHALVQRPDHRQPVAGRVVAVGRDGIHLRSDDGNVHRVRHEHVLDHRPEVKPEDAEFPEAAQALHRQGVAMDVEERFRKPSGSPGENATPKGAQDLLLMLEEQGVPIDAKRLIEEGTPEDIDEVLSRYVNLEPKPSQLPTTLGKERFHQAPGWEKVNPAAGGRISRAKNAPKREWADDNDSARDESFDGLKSTGMVGDVTLSPELAPDDQEHVLRVAFNTLKSLADVVEPPENPPSLLIGPTHPDDVQNEAGVDTKDDVGAHYDRRSNRLEIGLGMPESLTHAYGHVLDASLGGGKYASLDPKSPVGLLVEKIKGTAGVGELGNTLGSDNADEGRRFWMRPDELFARFFEQWVDSSVGEAAEPVDHHSYVSGISQPGSLDPDDMKAIGPAFRQLLQSRDRSGALAIRKRTSGRRIGNKSGKSGVNNQPDYLLEEAKSSPSEAGKRLVSALSHGIKPKTLERAPGHYDKNLAAEHAGIVSRAKRKAEGKDEREQLPVRNVPVRAEEPEEV